MSDEHYLPRALGRFEGFEPLSGRVCDRCNNEIGRRIETQFLRAGPTAFFRWLLGSQGRDGPPPSPFYRGAAGAPPLYMMGRAPDSPYDLLWEVHPGTEEVFPLRQAVFEHREAGAQPVAVLDRMRDRPDLLLQELRERGLEGVRLLQAFAGPDEIGWVGDLLRAIGVDPPDRWVTTNFPPQRIPIVVTATVTGAYFRAVAKIAFHYTLKMFPDLSGMEWQFRPVKEFIWDGSGEAAQFVRQLSDQFVENFRRGYRPTHWSHILAVTRAPRGITAYAQFFASPRSLPPPYQMELGGEPSWIVRRAERRAHQFVILDPQAAGGPAGRMVDFEPVNYVWIWPAP